MPGYTKSGTEADVTDGSYSDSDNNPDGPETKPSSADIESATETDVVDESDSDSDSGSDNGSDGSDGSDGSERGPEGHSVFYDVPESLSRQEAYIEGKCYLGNQMQQQPRGPQLWKEQVAGKQST
jgi:hypothetical protein